MKSKAGHLVEFSRRKHRVWVRRLGGKAPTPVVGYEAPFLPTVRVKLSSEKELSLNLYPQTTKLFWDTILELHTEASDVGLGASNIYFDPDKNWERYKTTSKDETLESIVLRSDISENNASHLLYFNLTVHKNINLRSTLKKGTEIYVSLVRAGGIW